MTIQAFIFDVDGVLTDTVELHFESWRHLAEEEGIPFTRAVNDDMRGLSRPASLQVFLGGRTVSEQVTQDYLRRKNGYFLAQLGKLGPADLLPGVLPLLQELKAAGIKIAVGSASKNAREVVLRLGIDGFIEAYVDGYAVERSKPAPDVFLAAAALLDVSPDTCVVVEDAEAGIEAAHAAGMKAVGVGESTRSAGADLWYESLQDVTLVKIAEALAARASVR